MDRELIYNYLLGVDNFTKREYNNLVKKYNKEDVDCVIERLILEDNTNMDKFSFCLDDVCFFIESKMDLLNYSIYLSDLKNLECFDSKKNMELLIEVHQYISKMDTIFDELGANEIKVNGKVPWICDKVEWCLNNCNDIDILNELKSLYKDYCNIRDKIVVGNLRFVLFNALEYNDDMTMVEDMIQYGNMGLIRAIEKFDVSKNVSFTTYASYWIRQSIIRGIKSTKYPIRVPMHIIYKYSLLMDTESMLSIEKGSNVKDVELADYMNLSMLNMEQIMNAFKIPFSMDEEIIFDSDDSDYVKSLKDCIPDLNVDVSEEVISSVYRETLLNFLFEYLIEREYNVVYLYYGFSGKDYTDREIAKEMGMSQQRVGQIKRDALVKLRRRDVLDVILD